MKMNLLLFVENRWWTTVSRQKKLSSEEGGEGQLVTVAPRQVECFP